MMPIMEGSPSPDFLEHVSNNPGTHPWEFLQAQLTRHGTGIKELNSPGILIRAVDNQRIGHFKRQCDSERINYHYVIGKMKPFMYSKAEIAKIQKKKALESLIPKKRNQKWVKQEIT
jgi:hypothetical protein